MHSANPLLPSVNTASEMTYIVSSGALNSTPTNQPSVNNISCTCVQLSFFSPGEPGLVFNQLLEWVFMGWILLPSRE